MLKTQLGSLKTELKSGAYRDASMAMCALVAAADGQVDASEMQQMESLILGNEVLQNFPPEQLRQRFHKHVDQLTRNFPQGKAEALQEIAKAAKKPTEARAVIQTGIVIAGADGHFSQAEQAILREACATRASSRRNSSSRPSRLPFEQPMPPHQPTDGGGAAHGERAVFRPVRRAANELGAWKLDTGELPLRSRKDMMLGPETDGE
ncbi:hypothetical protein SALBM217S_06344 [Streptomyces griseoloalbus]